MAWLWLNLSLGALFVLAIVAIPLWLVLRRPDTGPKPAELAAGRRAVSRRPPHPRAARRPAAPARATAPPGSPNRYLT